MLRPRLTSVGLNLNRYLHQGHRVAPLEHFENGIPGLFTREGFHTAYTLYQTLMVTKLNAFTAHAPDDHGSTTKSLLLKYARQSDMAALFNHASMAHNNHFFFSCLTMETQDIPQSLTRQIEDSFSSVETLKRDFLATANAMFGPGFVWLVQTNGGTDRKLALLTTYLAGSPYPGAHFRKQARDLNVEAELDNSADAQRKRAFDNMPISNTVGTHGLLSAAKHAPGGIDVIPLLCVSTWEHTFIHDWDVTGKPQFLAAWWDKIDWSVVSNRLGLNRPGFAF